MNWIQSIKSILSRRLSQASGPLAATIASGDGCVDAQAASAAAADRSSPYVERARRLLDFMNASHRERRLCDVMISTNGGELQVAM
jgi:hypothetical protein